MRGRIAAVCLLAGTLAGCYSAPQPDCGFGCGPGGACPDNYHCARDNRCHLDGTPDSLACAVDGGVDVLPIDVPIPPDTEPPYVLFTNPSAGEINVAVDAEIAVQFSEAVVNVDITSFLVDDGAAVSGTVRALSTMMTYVFTPTANLAANTLITVTLTSAIADTAGNPLAMPHQVSFRTAP